MCLKFYLTCIDYSKWTLKFEIIGELIKYLIFAVIGILTYKYNANLLKRSEVKSVENLVLRRKNLHSLKTGSSEVKVTLRKDVD